MAKRPKYTSGLLFAALSLCLVACETTGNLNNAGASPLAQRLKNDPHTSSMKNAALRKAVASEARALGNAAPGTKTIWEYRSEAKGEISVGQAFEVSGRICRRFDHTITISGISKNLASTACKTENGNWVPLS